MATQYDSITSRYGSMQDLPASSIERPSIEAVIGDVTGLRCLDLACGLGRWSKFLLERGAASVIGVYISESMIKDAIRDASTTWPDHIKDRVSFQVGDCTTPLSLPGRPFDVAFAAWLLNHAPTSSEQLSMWQNISADLRPGGRFIGVTPNVHMNLGDHPVDARYGYAITPLRKVEDGYECRLTAYTQPNNVTFDMYHLSKEVYERCAAEAGLVRLKWNGHVLPDDSRKAEGYWEAFDKRPTFDICTAWRSG